MRNCSWNLWLENCRIFNIRQLREHFDTPVLVGYYLGGGLERWLSDAGENAVLERVREIDRNGDIGGQLKWAFGVNPPEKENGPKVILPDYPREVRLALTATKTGVSCNGSFIGGSFRSSFVAGGSFAAGSSFKAGSSFTAGSSFNSGSSFRISSLKSGSFNIGSFKGYSFAKGSWRGGSFSMGSFRTGSFGVSSFRLVKTSFSGSFSGSFRQSGSGGSFRFYFGETELTKEEYKRTKINLSSCPLNAYGYGIHRI